MALLECPETNMYRGEEDRRGGERWNEERKEGDDTTNRGEAEEGHGSREDSREKGEEWTREQGWCDERRGGKRREQRMRR